MAASSSSSSSSTSYHYHQPHISFISIHTTGHTSCIILFISVNVMANKKWKSISVGLLVCICALCYARFVNKQTEREKEREREHYIYYVCTMFSLPVYIFTNEWEIVRAPYFIYLQKIYVFCTVRVWLCSVYIYLFIIIVQRQHTKILYVNIECGLVIPYRHFVLSPLCFHFSIICTLKRNTFLENVNILKWNVHTEFV